MMTWEEENNYIINNIFNNLIGKKHNKRQFLSPLELYITSDCNQKCEYCYLVKYGDKIYPKEIRDFDTILNNLKIFLNYLNEQKYEIPLINIFTGEIWHTKRGIQILDIILNYIKQSDIPPSFIMIPSNFTFILSDEYIKIIEYYIQEYKKAGTILHFSCSIDGQLLETENRSFKNNNNSLKTNDEYYHKLFSFLKKWNFGMHPMVNAYSIEKWKDQYKWWIDKIKEYDFTLKDIMFLEVRNDEWTKEKIFAYLDFLNTVCNYTLSNYFGENNFEEYILTSLGMNIDPKFEGYTNFRISKNTSMMQCTVDRMICIRLGDLAWVPCHRTSYEPFIYGKFEINDNKITELKANNIPLLLSVYSLGYKGHPKCDKCPIGDICMRGCYGAQFESTNEFFYPCPTVCDLWIAKALFLYYKNEFLIKKFNYDNINVKNKMQSLYDKHISKIPEEERNKWIATIKQLIVN